MPFGYRRLSAAALGVILVTFGTVLSPGASAAVPAAGKHLSFFGAVGDNDPDSTGYVGATVQACSSTACVSTQSSIKGEFSLYGLAPGEYTVTAYPTAADAGTLGAQTEGPFNVGAKTLYNPVFILPALNQAPSGVTFGGQSAVIPDVYWDSPAPLSVSGCAGGAGVAVVYGFDPATGTPDVELGRLTESPAGSGTYTATVPPLYPAHGTITVTSRTACSRPFAEQLGMARDLVRKMASSCAGAGAVAAFVPALNGAFARLAGNLSRPQGWVGAVGGLTGAAAAFLSNALQFPEDQPRPLLDFGFTVPELIAVGTMLNAVNGLARHGTSRSTLNAGLNCAEAVLYRVLPDTLAAGFSARAIPSGTVVDTHGNPVPGATVTLLQAPDAAQPFSVVAPASPGVEPEANPQTTDASGTFGWDLLGGRYEVTAQKAGCSAPGHAGQPVVTSPMFRGLPPQAGLVLTLSCPGEAPPSAPAVTALSTHSGPVGGGARVDVQGTGFTGSLTVTFGSRGAASVTVLSPAELVATAPAGTGTVDVRVRTAAGTSAATRTDRYTYVAVPAVTRIAPTSGPAKGGTVVTIAGTGFAPGDQVTFGSALAETVTVASASRIIAVSPTGLGPAAVTVGSADGLSKAVPADVFKFLLKPSFTSAAKATAAKGKGFRFTVRTTGYPVPALTWSGKLPRGLRITASNGTAVLAGTPAAAGRFVLRLTARNSQGAATQTLTITVKT